MPPALFNLIRRRAASAPDDMHYYDGKIPQRITAGLSWPGAKFDRAGVGAVIALPK